MIYANDQWIQLPVKDLYDSLIMLASINAAKDMYERGQQEMKDFKKEYGDFLSPILSDMDWYNKNVTGKVRDAINDLYARGIDPLRSSEGRAVISNVINNVNPGEVALRRQAAEAANQYIKSRNTAKADGSWDPDFEREVLGGQLLEEWDGSLGPWTATSVTPYQDYEKKYGHLFDKMGYEYDEEESKKYPGMMVMTKNKNRMHDILSANRPDLINDQQYKYDLGRIEKMIKAYNPNMSNDDVRRNAIKTLEDEIVNRNYKGGMQFTEDPIAKDLRNFKQQVYLKNLEHANNVRLEGIKAANAARAKATGGGKKASGGGGDNTDSGKESFSDAQYQFMRGVTNIVRNTSFGRAAGVSTYNDFDPNKLSGLVSGAQSEIASKIYNSDISGGGQITMNSNKKKNSLLSWDSSKNKFVSNKSFSGISDINLGDFSVSQAQFKPATGKKQMENLSQANKQFLDRLSTDYSPAKLAQWFNRSVESGDSTMFNISNDYDIINRLYSADNVALGAYGVNRPKSDLERAKGITEATRKQLLNNKNLYCKGRGKISWVQDRNGAVHGYAVVDIYKKSGKGTDVFYTKIPGGDGLVLDVGIDSYGNPNFGINGNASENLYFDETKDADTRFTGDQNVLKWERVGAPAIDSTIGYPQLPWQQ